MVNAIITGAAGRMGRLIVQAIQKSKGIKLSGALECTGHKMIGQDAGEVAGTGFAGACISCGLDNKNINWKNNVDVVIDFTTPECTVEVVKKAIEKKKPMVIGTTALGDNVLKKIKELSKIVPVVQAYNMSAGVSLLFSILPQIAKILGESYDIEIVEAHHRFKKDAPSGTAMKMAEILAKAKNLNLEQAAQHGRVGKNCERSPNEIGLHAVRAGDIVGEHTVIFGGLGERIEITHKAHSRETFARGAVRAALFVVQQRPGLYDMQDVLQ